LQKTTETARCMASRVSGWCLQPHVHTTCDTVGPRVASANTTLVKAISGVVSEVCSTVLTLPRACLTSVCVAAECKLCYNYQQAAGGSCASRAHTDVCWTAAKRGFCTIQHALVNSFKLNKTEVRLIAQQHREPASQFYGATQLLLAGGGCTVVLLCAVVTTMFL
jgi:hypothetical protein